MRSRTLSFLLAIGLALLLGSAASADDYAFEATSSGQLGLIDLSTGVFTRLGNSATPLIGLATYKGKLYGASGSVLYRVNPITGTLTKVGAASFSYRGFGSTTSGLYGFDPSMNLYSISPTTGSATLVGPTGLSNPTGFGVSTGSQTLYITPSQAPGCGNNDTFLYSVDTATGVPTLIGNTGLNCGSGGSVFENAKLYAGGFSPNAVYTLSTQTGTATFVANVSGTSGNFYGLAPLPCIH